MSDSPEFKFSPKANTVGIINKDAIIEARI
jgi:hypothetical protein